MLNKSIHYTELFLNNIKQYLSHVMSVNYNIGMLNTIKIITNNELPKSGV